jgi:hypothetical protein
MRGAITSLPQYVLMAWLLVKHRDNFIFTFTVEDNDRHASNLCADTQHSRLISKSNVPYSNDCKISMTRFT